MSKLSKCRCSSTCDQSHSNELRTSFSNTLFQQSHSGVTPLQFAIYQAPNPETSRAWVVQPSKGSPVEPSCWLNTWNPSWHPAPTARKLLNGGLECALILSEVLNPQTGSHPSLRLTSAGWRKQMRVPVRASTSRTTTVQPHSSLLISCNCIFKFP